MGKFIAIAIVIVLLGAGPTSQVTAGSQLMIVEEATTITNLKAILRGLLIRDTPNGRALICAQPPPSLVSAGTEGESRLRLDALQEVVQVLSDLTNRSELLQVQREALYRLCEFQLNSDLSNVTIFDLSAEARIKSLLLELQELQELLELRQN